MYLDIQSKNYKDGDGIPTKDSLCYCVFFLFLSSLQKEKGKKKSEVAPQCMGRTTANFAF